MRLIRGALSPRQLLLILAGMVGGGAALAVALLIVTRLAALDIASTIPLTPMIVTLSKPLDDSAAGVGAPADVGAEIVAAHPILTMELWVDGALHAASTPVSVGLNRYAGSTSWTPRAAGPHVLVVRATDDQGNTGVSNTVRVEAMVATESMAMEPFVAQGGETVEALAAQYGTTSDDILIYNSGLSIDSALEPGQELRIPVPSMYLPPAEQPPPAPPSPMDTGEPGSTLSPLVFWLRTRFGAAPDSAPAAPGLTGGARGCNAALSIDDRADGELGFFVYRLAPGGAGFERLAALGAHSGNGTVAYADMALAGDYTYYVSAFNEAGEAPGPIVQLAIAGAECATDSWTGDVRLLGGTLQSSVQVDRAYFYARLNGRDWRRIPSDPNAFLPALQGGYDASPFLSELAAGASGPLTSLSLDGGGWGDGGLTHLGAGNGTFSSSQGSIGLIDLYLWTELQGSHWTGGLGGDPSLIGFSSQEFVFAQPGNFLLRWKTGSPTASSGRWEVSLSPYFLPVAILAEGVEAVDPHADGYSYLNIPFDEILALTANIGDQQAAPPAQALVQVPFGSQSALNLGEGQNVVFELQLPAGLGSQTVQSQGGNQSVAFATVPLGMGGTLGEYYVRITPMIGNQPAGEPSNTVIARYDPTGEGGIDIEIPVLGPEFQTPLYTIELLEYEPGAVEDPNRWGCVEVVEVVPGSLADLQGWQVGTEHCPGPYTGGGYQGWKGVEQDLGLVGGWLEKGMDWASQAWQDIKEFAIQIVMKYTPLGWQCQFAEHVVLPEGTCHDVFAAAVDIGLASMGIPPTIPNFHLLMNQGIEYAVEVAEQEVLENSPIPCVGPCEDAVKDTIREALQSAIDSVAGQSIAPSCVSEQEAHENGREPWCPPDGLVVKPALLAVDRPPTVVLRLTRRPDVPDPANLPSCTLYVGARYTYHVGPAGYPDYSADPFGATYLPIPALAPGEWIDAAVALDQRMIVDFPWKSYVGNPYAYHDWGSMVYYGTSHGYAGASFVTPPYASGAPSPCALTVSGLEVPSPNWGN